MDDLISRQAAIDVLDALDITDGVGISSIACNLQEEAIRGIQKLPSAQPDVIRCKDCRYYKAITSIHGECESADMWQSLFGEVTEVEAIEVHKDHYCGYAERRTDETD